MTSDDLRTAHDRFVEATAHIGPPDPPAPVEAIQARPVEATATRRLTVPAGLGGKYLIVAEAMAGSGWPRGTIRRNGEALGVVLGGDRLEMIVALAAGDVVEVDGLARLRAITVDPTQPWHAFEATDE